MIPAPRLLLWTGCVALPLAVAGGLLPALAAVAWSLLALLAAGVAIDAVSSRCRLDQLSIEAPPVVRLRKDAVENFPLEFRHGFSRGIRLQVALDLPPSIASHPDLLTVQLLPEDPVARIDWSCTPQVRGSFPLPAAYVQAPSRLGFWQIRRHLPVETELRVYPNLLPERRNVAALFLARGRTGTRAQRAVGKGRDFEKLRDYVAGDSYEDIHWKASAKRGHPVTKVYQIERTQEVYVILDTSRLAARTDASLDPPSPVLERYLKTALVLALAAEQQGDLYGLVTFSNRIERFLPARAGRGHYDACREALYAIQPNIVSPSYEDLASFLRTRLRKRSLLLMLTSLDDPVLAENFVQAIDLVCRQHLILVNMPRPAKAEPIFSNPDVEDLEGIYESLGGHLRWRELRELEKVLQRRGVRFHLLEREQLTAEMVNQYLDVKARQLL